MPSKAGADLFWFLMGVSAVIMAGGVAVALVIFAVAPCGVM